MVIRPAKREDFERIDEIYRNGHDEDFSLPAMTHVLTHAVIEKDGKVIAFGVVKLYAEALMVLDLNESKIDRLDATEKLLHEAFRACESENIEQLHVYVQDPGMRRILEKRYEFKLATGVALVKEI